MLEALCKVLIADDSMELTAPIAEQIEAAGGFTTNGTMVMEMAQVSTLSKGFEFFSRSVQRPGRDHLERRRSGRQEQISPQLLSLLRDADKFAARSETPERLNPALALIVIVSCSATLWFGMIRAAIWLAG